MTGTSDSMLPVTIVPITLVLQGAPQHSMLTYPRNRRSEGGRGIRHSEQDFAANTSEYKLCQKQPTEFKSEYLIE